MSRGCGSTLLRFSLGKGCSFSHREARRMGHDLLRPNEYVAGVLHIDFPGLAERGLTHYCFDVDNTLVPQRGHELVEGVAERLRWAREAGYIRDLCLVSNVIWGARRVERLRRIAAALETEHCYPAMFYDRKPGPRGFRWAMERMGASPETTCVVGDQIFSDILGGNRLGLYTILVPALSPDHWSTTWTGRRWREKRLLRALGLEPRKLNP